MQIGIRLHDTRPLALPERLAHTREQGFTCAHVALAKVIDLSLIHISEPRD